MPNEPSTSRAGAGAPGPGPGRWREVQDLLDAALDVPAAERPALLDRACAHDPSLRDEVEQLLRACESAEDFLEEPVTADAGPLIADLAAGLTGPAPGARVGPYRVVRELGRGGMGVVYLAERDDGEYRKQVALKLVRREPGMEDAVARRFREERQILATLEHPGIARLLDGGVTPEGTPWFAMEYVAGLPVDRYCDEWRLTIDDRLALFCRVCDAVDYAHRHSVIHRDLKPSNILVTGDGDVKLLDFGIAKVVAEAGRGGALVHHGATALTRPGARLMTPEYASPEQVRGEPVTAASDVYSLGVLLYQLLTGRHPSRPTGQSQHEVERRILEDEPERPSAAVARTEPVAGVEEPVTPERVGAVRGTTGERLRRRLDGDLDTIVLAALRKEPERRYPSAGELAADVRRHLEGLPVRVRPDRWAYRARKFARRHPAGVTGVAVGASAAALVAAVLAGPRASRVHPAASMVAVLPFAPSAPDTALVRLGRDLAVTLSANLDGVGELHTVDALTTLAQIGRGAPVPDDAPALAHRLGASSVIRGTLVRVGDRVRVDAAFVPADSATPVARASATARLDDVGALTDSITWALLRQIWQRRPAPLPSLAAVTTHSVPALRTYLEGERLVTEYQISEAADAFARAVDADSTFWYAYWRYAWARAYSGKPVDSAITATYEAHRTAFPPRDRLLIEARMTGDLSRRIELTRALTKTHPDYWPGWFELAELLVHRAPYAGTTLAEARAPLERTVALNPGFLPAWDHLVWVGLYERDTAETGRVLAELKRLRYDSIAVRQSGVDVLLLYRWLDRLARTGGVPDEALTDSLAPALAPFAGAGQTQARHVVDWFQGGWSLYGFHRARIELARRSLRLGGPVPNAAFHWRVIATIQAARGAWDSALVAADSAIAVARRDAGAPAPAVVLFGYRLAAVGAWLGAVDPSVAAARRDADIRNIDAMPPRPRAELAWIDGLLAAARRDPGALARARAELRSLAAPGVPVLDSSLAAMELDLAGSRRGAVALLTALERDRYPTLDDQHPYVTGVDRILLGRWLFEAGDTAGAARVLAWHEAVLSPQEAPQTHHATVLLTGPAFLERARIEEAGGQGALAVKYYRQFLRRYDAPVAAHRHLVAEARSALDRLTRR